MVFGHPHPVLRTSAPEEPCRPFDLQSSGTPGRKETSRPALQVAWVSPFWALLASRDWALYTVSGICCPLSVAVPATPPPAAPVLQGCSRDKTQTPVASGTKAPISRWGICQGHLRSKDSLGSGPGLPRTSLVSLRASFSSSVKGERSPPWLESL